MKRERAIQSDENRAQHRALTSHADHHWPSFLRAARCDGESARDYCALLVPARVYHRPVRHCPDRAADRAWIATGDSARLAWSDALGSVFTVDRYTVCVASAARCHFLPCRFVLAFGGSVAGRFLVEPQSDDTEQAGSGCWDTVSLSN